MSIKKRGNKSRLFEVAEEPEKPSMMPALPGKLAAPPTAAAVAKGDYQKKLARHFAPELLPRAFQSLLVALDEGDPVARKQAFEIYGVLQSKVGGSFVVNLNNQTNVDARSASGGSRDDAAGLGSFEEIARTVSAERQKRLPGSEENVRPAIPAQFEATPED